MRLNASEVETEAETEAEEEEKAKMSNVTYLQYYYYVATCSFVAIRTNRVTTLRHRVLKALDVTEIKHD